MIPRTKPITHTGRTSLVLPDQLGGLNLFIVTEGNSVTRSKDERFISALLLNDGEIEGISRKRNLVPFGEAKNYSRGKDYDVYETWVWENRGIDLLRHKRQHSGATQAEWGPDNSSAFQRQRL